MTVRPILLPRVPLMNPRTVCACHPVAFMISAEVAPFLRWSMATTSAFLLPSRLGVDFGAILAPFAAFAGLVGFAGAGAAFLRLAFVGFASGAGGASTVSASTWIAFQTRVTPALR